MVVHRLLVHDSLRFSELREEIGGVTGKVISDTLDDMEEKDLVERSVVDEKPVQVEYALSERGESLAPIIEAMDEWGRDHLVSVDAVETPSA